MRPPETFSTKRLVARKPRAIDAPAAFAAYASDPEVTRYLAWKAYSEVSPFAEFLQARAEDWEKVSPQYAYLLCLRGTDAPIGSIAVHFKGSNVLFAYVLGRAFWGRGLMSEALGYLVNWSLEQPLIFRAWAFCDTANPASARVMEKAGMTHEGVLRRWFPASGFGPEPRDCFVYAKVK